MTSLKKLVKLILVIVLALPSFASIAQNSCLDNTNIFNVIVDQEQPITTFKWESTVPAETYLFQFIYFNSSGEEIGSFQKELSQNTFECENDLVFPSGTNFTLLKITNECDDVSAVYYRFLYPYSPCRIDDGYKGGPDSVYWGEKGAPDVVYWGEIILPGSIVPVGGDQPWLDSEGWLNGSAPIMLSEDSPEEQVAYYMELIEYTYEYDDCFMEYVEWVNELILDIDYRWCRDLYEENNLVLAYSYQVFSGESAERDEAMFDELIVLAQFDFEVWLETFVGNNLNFFEDQFDNSYKHVHCGESKGDSSLEHETVFAFFPNPTTDKLNVIGDNMNSLKVIDIQGREIVTATSVLKSTSIDVSSLMSGTYFLQIENTNGQIEVLKFVKQ